MGLVTIVTRLGSLSQENLRNCTILELMLMTKPAKAAPNTFRSEDYQRAMELAMPLVEELDCTFGQGFLWWRPLSAQAASVAIASK